MRNAGRVAGRDCPTGRNATVPSRSISTGRITPNWVYFDRANYSKLVRRSRRTGRPLSEIVYELAVNGYVKEALPQDAVSAFRALAGMANNLNQLARLGHIHGTVHIAEENNRLSKEISELIVRLNEQL